MRRLSIAMLFAVIYSMGCANPAAGEPVREGYAALQAQDYAKASVLLGRAVNSNPQDALARRYLAFALLGINQPEPALCELRAAQAIDGIKEHDATIAFRAQLILIRKSMSKGALFTARQMADCLRKQKLTPQQLTELNSISDQLESAPVSPAAPLNHA